MFSSSFCCASNEPVCAKLQKENDLSNPIAHIELLSNGYLKTIYEVADISEYVDGEWKQADDNFSFIPKTVAYCSDPGKAKFELLETVDFGTKTQSDRKFKIVFNVKSVNQDGKSVTKKREKYLILPKAN
jgi:hypothetical protein